MEKQMAQTNASALKPEPPLGVFGILKESLWLTTTRNGKLAGFILLLVFLTFSQLELGTTIALAPVLKDLSSRFAANQGHPSQWPNQGHPSQWPNQGRSSQWPNQGRSSQWPNQGPPSQWANQGRSSQWANQGHASQWESQDLSGGYSYVSTTGLMVTVKEIREVLWVKSLVVAFSCVVLLFFFVSVVSSSYEAHTAKVLSLKDMLLKVRASWKRPIVTSFYLSLISFGIVSFYTIGTVGLVIMMTGPIGYMLLCFALSISIIICYIFMAALWMMSLVVSVLEDVSGLKAITRAAELMKGKRAQASRMMLLFKFAHIVVSMATLAVASNLGKWEGMAFRIPFVTGSACVLMLLTFVAFTVFYHDRKKSHEAEGVKGQAVGLYVPIASDESEAC